MPTVTCGPECDVCNPIVTNRFNAPIEEHNYGRLHWQELMSDVAYENRRNNYDMVSSPYPADLTNSLGYSVSYGTEGALGTYSDNIINIPIDIQTSSATIPSPSIGANTMPIDMNSPASVAQHIISATSSYGVALLEFKPDSLYELVLSGTPVTVVPERKGRQGRPGAFSRANTNDVTRIRMTLNFPPEIVLPTNGGRGRQLKPVKILKIDATGTFEAYDLRVMLKNAKRAWDAHMAGASAREALAIAQQALVNQELGKIQERQKTRKIHAEQREDVFMKLKGVVVSNGTIESECVGEYLNLHLPNGMRARIEASHDGARIVEVSLPVTFNVDDMAKVGEYLSRLNGV